MLRFLLITKKSQPDWPGAVQVHFEEKKASCTSILLVLNCVREPMDAPTGVLHLGAYTYCVRTYEASDENVHRRRGKAPALQVQGLREWCS